MGLAQAHPNYVHGITCMIICAHAISDLVLHPGTRSLIRMLCLKIPYLIHCRAHPGSHGMFLQVESTSNDESNHWSLKGHIIIFKSNILAEDPHDQVKVSTVGHSNTDTVWVSADRNSCHPVRHSYLHTIHKRSTAIKVSMNVVTLVVIITARTPMSTSHLCPDIVGVDGDAHIAHEVEFFVSLSMDLVAEGHLLILTESQQHSGTVSYVQRYSHEWVTSHCVIHTECWWWWCWWLYHW